MRNLKALMLSGLFCWLTSHAFGQLIKGEVHDKASHAPLPGASITLPSQRKGVSTDPSGAFSIQANGAKTLKVSIVGYKPQTVALTDATFYKVELELSDKSMG